MDDCAQFASLECKCNFYDSEPYKKPGRRMISGGHISGPSICRQMFRVGMYSCHNS